MSRMIRSLSSELRKVLATKLWWILAIVLAAYSAMMAGTFAFLFSAAGEAAGGPALHGQAAANMVYSTVSSLGYAIPLLFGALLATGELRYRTLGLTFMLEPRRGLVLLNKAIVLIKFGIVLGVAGLIGSMGAGALVLSMTGGDPMLASSETWALAVRVAVAVALWSVIGFGIGVLVQNQAITIVIGLVFTQFIEPTLRTGAAFWDWSAQVARFLPGSATDSFVGASLLNNLSSFDASLPPGAEPLGIGSGFLVLAAYAVVVLLLGWLLRWRRDVT